MAAFYASSGRGWNRATEPYASISMKDALFEWIAMYLMYEAVFYTNHRILHITKLKLPLVKRPINLYSLYHKEHHSTFASVGVSGLYMGSLDCLLTQTLPQVIGPALFDFHPMVLWLGALIGSLNAVHTHSAYDFWGMSQPHGHEVRIGRGPTRRLRSHIHAISTSVSVRVQFVNAPPATDLRHHTFSNAVKPSFSPFPSPRASVLFSGSYTTRGTRLITARVYSTVC